MRELARDNWFLKGLTGEGTQMRTHGGTCNQWVTLQNSAGETETTASCYVYICLCALFLVLGIKDKMEELKLLSDDYCKAFGGNRNKMKMVPHRRKQLNAFLGSCLSVRLELMVPDARAMQILKVKSLVRKEIDRKSKHPRRGARTNQLGQKSGNNDEKEDRKRGSKTRKKKQRRTIDRRAAATHGPRVKLVNKNDIPKIYKRGKTIAHKLRKELAKKRVEIIDLT